MTYFSIFFTAEIFFWRLSKSQIFLSLKAIQKTTYRFNNLITVKISRVKPKTIMEPLFTSSIHLVDFFAVSVKLKRGCVTDVTSGFRALVDICINKLELRETFAELLKCRKNLATNSTPESLKSNAKISRNLIDRVHKNKIILIEAFHQTLGEHEMRVWRNRDENVPRSSVVNNSLHITKTKTRRRVRLRRTQLRS